jgi:ribosomal protein S18 acetylase RimI-like enzyme
VNEVVALLRHEDEEGTATWEVRRADHAVGTARTQPRRGGQLLAALDVPAGEAPAAFAAVGTALRARGEESVAVDVPTGHEVLTAALAGLDARLVATQMRLDLTRPVEAPDRVVLRAMTRDEFAAYREHLVTAYAQDMVDAGAFDDLPTALTASERSTRELLPEGPGSPGHHLWSAVDGDTAVGILWIHAEGAKAFIYDLEVRQEQRRRGYGQEMLDAGALAAVDLGARTLALNVFGPNDGARALYERAGYDTTEQTYRIVL